MRLGNRANIPSLLAAPTNIRDKERLCWWKQHVLRASRFTMHVSKKKDIAKKEKVKLLFCAPGIKHVFDCTLCPQLWHWKTANGIFCLVACFVFIHSFCFTFCFPYILSLCSSHPPPTALFPRSTTPRFPLRKEWASQEYPLNIT